MQIRCAHPTCIDLNIDVVVRELLQLEGAFVEIRVRLRAIDLEADRFFGVGHFDGSITGNAQCSRWVFKEKCVK